MIGRKALIARKLRIAIKDEFKIGINPIPDGVGGIHQDFTETLITRKVCAFKTWERCLNFPWFIA